MYPNLYYVFKDWFGVEWHALSFLNTFGLFVALSFLAAALVLSLELKRKERAGLLLPREEMITVGKPAGAAEVIVNAAIGFLFAYKITGLFFNKSSELNAQEYIFTADGSFLGGIIGAVVVGGLKWWDKQKSKLPNPERRTVRIWPHDRVGDIVIIALVFGIIGAKLFDSVENWESFIAHPIETLFSRSGLTFYGGLIIAAIAVIWFSYRKGILIKHLVDAAAPSLMLAYAIGRIGCQVSGDGDWGIYNSAYTSNEYGELRKAKPGDFSSTLNSHNTYFLQGQITENGKIFQVTDRVYSSLKTVPVKSFSGPDFLPQWLFAYAYPKNVNADGIPIPGDSDEHNKVLPQPVFPTPLYETIMCLGLFVLMWFLRKRMALPWMMFGLYLVLNGLERFLIETMRVNKLYAVLGVYLTQAEIIAISLILIGLSLIIYTKIKNKNNPIPFS